MASGMASRKVTATLPPDQVDAVRRLVAAGQATSVSGFVQRAVAIALDDAAGWERTLEEALERSGGALTAEERAWADDVLGATRKSVA